MLLNRIKLAKALLKLAEAVTDKGILIYEGELLEGIEVFVEREGEILPAEDGEYIYEGKKLIVKEGKIEAIEEILAPEPEPEPEPEVVMEEEAPVVVVEEPAEEDKDAIIAELEERLAAKDEAIAVLDAKVKELEEALATKEEALQMSADKPAKEKIKEVQKAASTGLKFNVLKH